MQRALVILIAGAVLLAPALAAQAQQGPATPPARSTPFPDVPKGHWAYDAVEQLRQRGILRGYPPEPKSATPIVSARRRSGHRGSTRPRHRR